MFRKAFFILVCIAALAFVIYKVTGGTIGGAADGANISAVEEYANAIKLSTVNTNNILNQGGTTSYDNVNVATSVKCEQVNVSGIGEVELHGCTVGGTSRKYQYVNGKASRE